jgi:hypothetical protein
MRAKTLLTLCCFLTLLLVGAALFAAPAPVQNSPLLDEITAPPACSAAPAAQSPQTALGLAGGSAAVQSSACPVAIWQACFQHYGTCTLCFCLGSACECENRCV